MKLEELEWNKIPNNQAISKGIKKSVKEDAPYPLNGNKV